MRFRIGKASTAHKGYTLLIDTNNSFGNTGSSNPGFEKEIVLETGVGVKIYTHNVAAGTSTSETFNLDQHHQRSIALSTNNGDADYFYDYYVPFSNLGISTNVRFAATTITSAQSGINGTASDINGINDAQFGGNTNLIYTSIINSFPSTNLNNLNAGGAFAPLITSTPTITNKLTTANTVISGTSQEANGTLITVYNNGVAIGTTTVNSNAWTLTGVSGLIVGNMIKATATATGKGVSADSNIVEVTAVQTCYLPSPTNLSRTNGSQVVTGNWTNGLPISANTVRIRLYSLNANSLTFTELTSTSNHFVNVDGTWSFTTNVSQSTFNGLTIYAVAEFASCTSDYSNGAGKTSGGSSIITPTPSVITSPILASTGSQTINVQNTHTATATIYLYVNGTLVLTNTGVSANATTSFSVTGLIEGDLVYARAIDVVGANYFLSNISNERLVIGSIVQTSAPVITGTYISGNTSVSGISNEAAGTVIKLYKNGSTLIGTATVNAFGSWTLSGLSLTTGDVLTATALATGKTLSNISNSITVASGIPAAPTVNGGIVAGSTSISGTGGAGTVVIYVDGTSIGTTSGATWTLTGFDPNELYKGAVITAKNLVSGILSNSSNQVIATGVVSFKVTNPSDNELGTFTAGDLFNIKIVAKDAVSGTGNTVTTFAGNVVVSSNSAFLSGNGASTNFTSGVLNPHPLALINAGIRTITVVSTTDPTAVGTAQVTIVAGPASKFITHVSETNISGGAQITVTAQLTDQYNNPVSTAGLPVTWTSINGGTFSLNPSNTDSNGLATVTFTSVNANTTHQITATSGAITGSSEVITVNYTLSTEDEILNKTVKLYPNPVQNQNIFLQFTDLINKNVAVLLYNQLGAMVHQSVVRVDDNNQLTISIPTNISRGIYVLKVKFDGKIIHKKIIIE